MQYTIIGSDSIVINDQRANRLCHALGVDLIGILVDKENDRHPLHFIDVESKTFLTTDRVKEVFGPNFEVKYNGTSETS